jgi:hypothetical protein
MRAARCNYLLDFNPRFDKLRTEWDRERQAAMASQDRLRALDAADAKFIPLIEPILEEDVREGRVRCKADSDVPCAEPLSLDQIAGLFGITRPRVQQIEARARLKMAELRHEVRDFLVESTAESKEDT